MSRTYHHGERRYVIKAVRRKPADMRKLARALIALAEAEAEKEAALGRGKPRRSRPKSTKPFKPLEGEEAA